VPAARRPVLLFTKPPVAGRVKTRLIGPLTARQAAELHGAFLGDLVDRLSAERLDLILVWALEAGEALPLAPPGGRRQIEGDLGARMRQAFTELLPASGRTGLDRFAVAIGGDLPQLAATRIEEAFAALEEGAGIVLGPAVDGGYYLIGLGAAALAAPIFEKIAWSTDAVLAQTLERCRAAGLEVALLAEEEDIDTADGLERFAVRLAAGELPACPRTAALLGAWSDPMVADGGRSGLEGGCVS
jgi:rSAM/selenodomain-associated transferase 1